MKYLRLDEALRQLHVDDDSDDLVYICELIDMAENTLAIELGEDLEDLEDENGQLPERLKHTLKVLVAHFYLVREPVIIGTSASKVPMGFDFLIAPFKNWTVG